MLRRLVILAASLSGAAAFQIHANHAPFDASLAFGDWRCHGSDGTFSGDVDMSIAEDGAMRMLLTLTGPDRQGRTIVAKARYRGTAGVREREIFQTFASIDVIDAKLDGVTLPADAHPILEGEMTRQDAVYPIDKLSETELVWLTGAGPIRCKRPV